MCVLITSQEDHKDNIIRFLGSKGFWFSMIRLVGDVGQQMLLKFFMI
jgi:hypothetical protein